jgi:hypothetical protein
MNFIQKILATAAFVSVAFFVSAQVEDPTVLVEELNQTISETSGLAFINGRLWTHNDSDGEPKIYCIDTITGQVIGTKVIAGVTNEDWEDLAKDKTHLYIGNFGSVSTNLQILRIKIEDLENPMLDTIVPRIINFTYGNSDYPESDFSATNTRFDCEAMIAKDDTIFLFSKNWIDHKTYLYAIPNKANDFHTITPMDTLQLDYLVCGADYDYTSNTIALVGYTYDVSGSIPDSKPYITLLRNFEGNRFFTGTVETKNFSALSIKYSQTEGIAFRDYGRLWVTNEKYTRRRISIKSKLREFRITEPQIVNNPNDEPTFPEEPDLTKINGNDSNDNTFYPNPAHDSVNIYLEEPYTIEIVDLKGVSIFKSSKENIGNTTLDISFLPQGSYIVRLTTRDTTREFKFIKL